MLGVSRSPLSFNLNKSVFSLQALKMSSSFVDVSDKSDDGAVEDVWDAAALAVEDADFDSLENGQVLGNLDVIWAVFLISMS